MNQNIAPTADLNTESRLDIKDLLSLLKPRVMSLAIFTSAVAMFIAPGDLHPIIAVASILFIAVGAGASGALNMWWDADIDGVMVRTRSRPIPSGKVSKQDALFLGAWLSCFSVVMLALTSNLLAGALLAITIFYYVVIYTMLLKRRTPQNIVIGGAAGAFPPIIGWVVSTGTMPIESWLLFLLIFLWTPPHFWALALYNSNDYRQAQVPMLTLTSGGRSTRIQILIYTILLIPVSVSIALSSIGGPTFVLAAIVMNVALLYNSVCLLRRTSEDGAADRWLWEKKFFRLSIIYLFVLFCALTIDKLLLIVLGDYVADFLALLGWIR